MSVLHTPKELWDFMRLHQIQCESVLKEVIAQRDAANAHCTLARRQIDSLTKKLANRSQSKWQKSKKTEARLLTLPSLREEFEMKDAEDEAKEKAELEKAAQKKADETARMLRINEETRTRIFDCPLTSYKRKDDLVALAGALSLPTGGTIAELTKTIRGHLAENPTRENEPRFSGLFGSSRKRTSEPTTGPTLGPSSGIPSLRDSMSYTHAPANYMFGPGSDTLPMSHNAPGLNMPPMPHNAPGPTQPPMSHDAPDPNKPPMSNSPPSPNEPPMSHGAPSPNEPLMSHNATFVPHLPYHSYSHLNSAVNSSYNLGHMPFN